MINLRESHIEDLILLAENAMDDDIDTSPSEIRLWARYNMDCGPVYTAECGGKIIAAGGMRIVRSGLGDLWITISKDIEHSYGFLKEALTAMRNMTEILAETFGIRKMRIISRIGFPASQSLLRHLGFRRLRKVWKSYYIYTRRF